MIVDLGTMGSIPILNGYLLLSDDQAAIVDTGPSSVTDEYISRISKYVDPSKVSLALITHVHIDHGGGAWRFADLLPGIKFAIYEKGARHLIDPAKLIEASAKTLGDIFKIWGEVRPVSADRVISVRDGESIKVGKYELQLISTPGHASHSSAWYLKNERVLFPGDSMGMLFGNVIWPAAPPPFNMDMFEQSIKKMIGLNPKKVCFPHFGCADSNIFNEVLDTYKKINELVMAHCKESDDQILRDILSLEKYSSMPDSEYFREFLKINLKGLPNYELCRNPLS